MTMARIKVIEVWAESEKSWEDAVRVAITKAAETVHNIKSIYIKEIEPMVEDGRITGYRINANINFIQD
jgi:flavin-binding protein dodecin